MQVVTVTEPASEPEDATTASLVVASVPETAQMEEVATTTRTPPRGGRAARTAHAHLLEEGDTIVEVSEAASPCVTRATGRELSNATMLWVKQVPVGRRFVNTPVVGHIVVSRSADTVCTVTVCPTPTEANFLATPPPPARKFQCREISLYPPCARKGCNPPCKEISL